MAMGPRVCMKSGLAPVPALFAAISLSLFCCNSRKPTKPEPDFPPAGPMAIAPAWSPDGGSIIYLRAGYSVGNIPYVIYRLDVRTGAQTAVIEKGFVLDHMDWSPDGLWIVFESWGRIYKMKADGDSITQLTAGADNYYPNWSPDGSHIAFDARWASDSLGMYTMKPDGTDIQHVGVVGLMADWFPDGDTLVAVLRPDSIGCQHLGIFSLVNPSPVVISGCSFYARSCSVSPDGARIAFEDRYAPPSHMAIYVLNRGNTIAQRISPSPFARDPAWSPDGRYLVYANVFDGALYTYDIQTEETKRITPVLRGNDP